MDSPTGIDLEHPESVPDFDAQVAAIIRQYMRHIALNSDNKGNVTVVFQEELYRGILPDEDEAVMATTSYNIRPNDASTDLNLRFTFFCEPRKKGGPDGWFSVIYTIPCTISEGTVLWKDEPPPPSVNISHIAATITAVIVVALAACMTLDEVRETVHEKISQMMQSLGLS